MKQKTKSPKTETGRERERPERVQEKKKEKNKHERKQGGPAVSPGLSRNTVQLQHTGSRQTRGVRIALSYSPCERVFFFFFIYSREEIERQEKS